MSTCMCCPALRPRYKRLVDNIFPRNNEGGLVRSEMEKLTYYAVSAPEKLDRIGDYLAHRLTRGISRKRDNSVFIAMEALDQLLLACHAQQINLFVESFLKMVANLLESDNLDFQALGTNSFVKFSQIEEDTASYHRRYDFFVSKFSAMCHSNLKNTKDRKKIQTHGVRGIHSVVRKAVADELQVNIWHKHHIDKIVPSLLYIMMHEQNQESPGRRESYPHPHKETGENLGMMAEDCLRELLSRASYSNVASALYPAVNHLDSHNKWDPVNTFAIKCFKVFMYSIQAQYSHVIVKTILDHLDKQDADKGQLKASMLEVLCAVVEIPSSSPIGPAVIEVFSQLIRHLEVSVDSKNFDEQDVFQSTFIATIGTLCDVLPEYQKLEAMVFFINKAKEILSYNNFQNLSELNDEKAEKMLSLVLQNLSRISQKYNSKNLSGLSSSLLDPLIKVSSNCSPKNRLLTQEVICRLLIKAKASEKLEIVNAVSGVEALNLTITEATVQDVDFLERKLSVILQWVFESACLPDNIPENYVTLYKCASMICISLASPDVITDVCRVMLALQDVVIHPQSHDMELDARSKTLVINMMSSCMCIIAYVSKVSLFTEYVSGVMKSKRKKYHSLDPGTVLKEPFDKTVLLPDKLGDSVLFMTRHIQSALEGANGYKIEKIAQPFVPSFPGEAESAQVRRSTIDSESVRIDVMGVTEEQPKSAAGEKVTAEMITFDYLKKKLSQPPPTPSDIAERKREAAEHVMSSTFEKLVSEMQARMPVNDIRDIVNSISPLPENDSMPPFMLPEECIPGTNNIVFPTICVL